jgi:tRNA A37 threonylcarbamoyladenosine dehydratase
MLTESFQTRFGGIARLYGTTALRTFQTSRVAVVGIGGVGSWAAEALARSGVGSLTLVDLDELCLTNINRQLHAMDGHIGRLKTAAMAERIRAINPEAEVIEHPTFLGERNIEEILAPGFDAVIDAIDVINPKCLLIAECVQRSIHIVTSGGAGGRTDPTQIAIADLAHTHHDGLLNQVRRKLRADYQFPTDSNKPPAFGVTAVFSPEEQMFSQCDGSVSPDRPADSPARLNCASGYGTATHLTATFGLFAASAVLKNLAARPRALTP